MRKIILIPLACMYYSVQAQTVVWQMPPTKNYSSIERISNNLFKVVRDGKIGLIKTDCSEVTPAINDNISDYYEHKALITCNDGGGERITGCLTDNGQYYGYSAKYYTLNGQKFFSDGLLSVKDENGKLGYIDERGNQIVGFDGKYTRIKPFTEGYATVMRDKKYVLINKDGDEVKFDYGKKAVGAAIAGCTNVYKGKAYVYDEYDGEDRSYFIYDAVRGGALVKTKRVKETATDYLYCYQFVTGRTKDVPFEKMKQYSGDKGLIASSSNGLYGYVSDGKVIVPEQFSFASQFEDDLAIVSIHGQMGILKYIKTESFGVSVPKEEYEFYDSNIVSCNFNLSVPEIWQDKSIDVVLKDETGNAMATTSIADSYTFNVKPAKSEEVKYVVTVSAEGLRLYETQIAYSFMKRERCVTCGKDKRQCEYNGNHPIPQISNMPRGNACPTCGKNNCKTHCYDCGKKIRECEYGGKH